MGKTEKTNYIAQSLTGILDIIICLLLFITSIYKGSFYKSDFLFPNAIISIIGTIYLVYKIIKEVISKSEDKKVRPKLKIFLDMFMLLLPFTYLLPIIFKKYVSLPDSIFEMLRYVNMTVIYYIVRNTKSEKIYLNIFVIISIVQSILGIDQLTFRTFEKFLNTISTGYLPNNDRLSATIQYANVTGIVIAFGLVICFNKLSNLLAKKNKYIEKIICVFAILLEFSAIILTDSRTAIIISALLLFVDCILNFVCISKKQGIYKLILGIFSVFSSSIIEMAISRKEYLKIYILLGIFAIAFVLITELIRIIFRFINEKIVKESRVFKVFGLNNRFVKIIIVIFVLAITIVLQIAPKKLRIVCNTQEPVEIERSIYDFKEGENELDVKVNTYNSAKYSADIIEIKENYTSNVIANFNNYNKEENTFNVDFEVSKNAKKISVIIKVQDGNIDIERFKINNKNIKLSYILIPDSIVFKIKDTLSGAYYGDYHRLEYVKDTFKLFMKNPIIGIGGEGFKHTYASVQSIGYVSSEAHSAVLQSLVEVGTVGTVVFLGILCVSVCIIIKLISNFKRFSLEDKMHISMIASIYILLFSIMIVDLAFSYAFMIYVFAIVTALLLKAYIDTIFMYEKIKESKSKIDWSYIKIVVLSMSVVTFVYASYFSINAYRASLIKVPNKSGDLNILEVAENIAYLELKRSQDRYDMDYMKELNKEYYKYKELVTEGYINAGNDKEIREELNKELKGVVIKIKENTDKMLEYEYYDKYVLNDVADVYIENYIIFADIYKEQFSSEEVAYAFYLNYALKLTDRIIMLSPLSNKANEIYHTMCNKYIGELEDDNKYLNSDVVTKAINQFKERVN